MREDRSGYVYLLKARVPFEGCYKIGRTANPKRRLHDFGVKLPYATEPVIAARVLDMFDIEATLHDAMAHRRVGGEWFRLSPDEVAFVRAALLLVEADYTLEMMGRRRPVYAGGNEPEAFVESMRKWLKVVARSTERFSRRLATVRQLNEVVKV